MPKEKLPEAKPIPAPSTPLVQTLLNQTADARTRPVVPPPSSVRLVDQMIDNADAEPRRSHAATPVRPQPLMESLARQEAPPATASTPKRGPTLATLVAGAAPHPPRLPAASAGGATLRQSSERQSSEAITPQGNTSKTTGKAPKASLAETVISQQAAFPRHAPGVNLSGRNLAEHLADQPLMPRVPPAKIPGNALVNSAEAPDPAARRVRAKRTNWTAAALVLVAVLMAAAWIRFGRVPR
jgi:hypothetical protein